MIRDPVFIEKLALLGLAAASIGALTWIALAAMRLNGMDPNAATLIGGIATGLIAFGKDIVAAIRAYAMSAQLGKVTDQLAASGPVLDPALPRGGLNDPDRPTGTTEDPVHVEQETKP